MPVGLGDEKAHVRVYIANRPPLSDYLELAECRPMVIGEIARIAQETGNHWRKIFNVYAKLMAEYRSEAMTSTWQAWRDDVCEKPLPVFVAHNLATRKVEPEIGCRLDGFGAQRTARKERGESGHDKRKTVQGKTLHPRILGREGNGLSSGASGRFADRNVCEANAQPVELRRHDQLTGKPGPVAPIILVEHVEFVLARLVELCRPFRVDLDLTGAAGASAAALRNDGEAIVADDLHHPEAFEGFEGMALAVSVGHMDLHHSASGCLCGKPGHRPGRVHVVDQDAVLRRQEYPATGEASVAVG